MRKNHIQIIAVIILILLWLVLSNTVIGAVINRNRRVSKIEDVSALIKDMVFLADDIPYVTNLLFDEITYDDYAFCETEEDNSNKEVHVLLRSENNIYMVDSDLHSRADAINNFPNRDVQGTNHGFSTGFSMLGFPGGVYQIGVYCKENDENYGVIWTKYFFKKDASGVSRYIPNANEKTDLPVSDQAVSNYSMDHLKIIDGHLQIEGWAVQRGFESSQVAVYVELENLEGETAVFDTIPVMRPSVAELLGNDAYLWSGIISDINDPRFLKQEQLKMRFITEAGEETYITPRRVYVRDSDAAGSYAVEGTDGLAPNANEKTDLILRDKAVSNYQIESLEVVDGHLQVEGWAMQRGFISSQVAAYVELENPRGQTAVFDTRPVARHDVAEFLGDNTYLWSGIVSDIDDPRFLGQEQLKMRFITEACEETYVTPRHVYVRDSGAVSSYAEDGTDGPAPNANDRTDFTIRDKAVSDYQMDSFVDVDGRLRVEGWTTQWGVKSSQVAVYVELENLRGQTAVFDTRPVARHDVAEFLGDNTYLWSGIVSDIDDPRFSGQGQLKARLITEANGKTQITPWHIYLKESPEPGSYANIRITGGSPYANEEMDLTASDKAVSNYQMDSLEVVDGHLRVEGWAIQRGVRSSQVAVYVELENLNGQTAVFDTKPAARHDAAQLLGDDMYLWSGIVSEIEDLRFLNQEQLKIRFITEADGKTYVTPRHIYVKDSDESDSYANVWTTGGAPYANEETDLNISDKAMSNYQIESLEVVVGHLQVEGWAMQRGFTSSQVAAYVELENPRGQTAVFDTRPVARHDVAEFLGDNTYLWSGIVSDIDDPRFLDQEQLKVRFIIEADGWTYVTSWHVYESDSLESDSSESKNRDSRIAIKKETHFRLIDNGLSGGN